MVAFLAAAAMVCVAIAGCGAPAQVPSAGTPSSPSPSAVATASVLPTGSDAATPSVFAIIGDYGTGDRHARSVARLVRSWDPEFIVTAGDDYYDEAGGTGRDRYERSTGALYGDWLPGGAKTTGNAFYPALGNHDYTDAGISNYLRYFRLPGPGSTSTSGNERYYDFVRGRVHFFVINTDVREKDGNTASSKQARWLKEQLAVSTSEWNIVVGHHPPYSSDSRHGSSKGLRWPFADWGADVVVSGHSHTYERIERGGILYIVNGLGGAERYAFGSPVHGSKLRFRRGWGAQRVTVSGDALVIEFFTTNGTLIDSVRVPAGR